MVNNIEVLPFHQQVFLANIWRLNQKVTLFTNYTKIYKEYTGHSMTGWPTTTLHHFGYNCVEMTDVTSAEVDRHFLFPVPVDPPNELLLRGGFHTRTQEILHVVPHHFNRI